MVELVCFFFFFVLFFGSLTALQVYNLEVSCHCILKPDS